MKKFFQTPSRFFFKNKKNIILPKAIFFFAILFLMQSFADAQNLPRPIKKYLDSNYITKKDGNWMLVASACDEKKSVLTGDFDGDGQKDYLVRFKTGKTAKSAQLHLVTFFNQKGKFTPNPFYKIAYAGDLRRSSTIIVKKGNTVIGLGAKGDGPNMVLKTDAIYQYICEALTAKIFVYQNGEMKNIKEIEIPKPSTPSSLLTPKVENPPTNNPTPTPPTTSPTPVSIENEILNEHNKYREEVGTSPLKWSETLAQSAQKWANELAKKRTLQHSRSGENTFMGTANRFSHADMVRLWASEKKNFVNKVFPKTSTTGNWFDVSHYTQVIWKTTTEVGCGKATDGKNDYLVCHYNPAGNVEGQTAH